MEEIELIILVYACYTKENYKNQIKCVNNTWGKKCEEYKNIKLLYFLGEEKISEFTDTEYIKYINLPGIKDDYYSASYKQFLGLKYIYDNYNPKFVMCCGTDTYLNIPKLMTYINNFNSNDCLYIGGHGCNRQIGNKNYYFHSGGAGFILSYNCLQKIYKLLYNLMNDWINICKLNNIEDLIPACDVAISYYVQQPEINATIIKAINFTFIGCNYVGNKCCGNQIEIKNLISCHNMSENDFYNYTDILNKNNFFI
jgi:hypothetical protein